MKANLIKRGVAAAVFAGMLAATPCVANATTITDLPTITKNWDVASASQFQAQDFKFTVKYYSYSSSNTSFASEVKENSTVITPGNWSTTETVSFTGNETGTNNTYTETTHFLSGLDFTQPGQYTFSVTENAITDNVNVTKDGSTYYVTVNVEWANGSLNTTSIKNIVYRKNKTTCTDKVEGVVFSNTPAAQGGNDSLKITKTVSGTAANTSDVFSYTVVIDKVTGNYSVSKSDSTVTIKDKSGNAVSSVSNGTYTVTLSSGQSLSVANLPVGATYSVTEAESNYEEYVTTNSGADASATSDTTENRVATGKVDVDGATVGYTNKKGFAPDSGITMNTLPFIGVGAVAAASAVTLVISRKRRAGEDF